MKRPGPVRVAHAASPATASAFVRRRRGGAGRRQYDCPKVLQGPARHPSPGSGIPASCTVAPTPAIAISRRAEPRTAATGLGGTGKLGTRDCTGPAASPFGADADACSIVRARPTAPVRSTSAATRLGSTQVQRTSNVGVRQHAETAPAADSTAGMRAGLEHRSAPWSADMQADSMSASARAQLPRRSSAAGHRHRARRLAPRALMEITEAVDKALRFRSTTAGARRLSIGKAHRGIKRAPRYPHHLGHRPNKAPLDTATP